MVQDENIRELIRETTGLLRELILEQGRKLDALKMNEQLTIDAVKDVTSLFTRVERLEEKQAALAVLVAEHRAAAVIVEKYQDKEEGRAYVERKTLLEKVWANAGQIAGISALIMVVVQKIFF